MLVHGRTPCDHAQPRRDRPRRQPDQQVDDNVEVASVDSTHELIRGLAARLMDRRWLCEAWLGKVMI
jgi:hypothetical protein